MKPHSTEDWDRRENVQLNYHENITDAFHGVSSARCVCILEGWKGRKGGGPGLTLGSSRRCRAERGSVWG